MLLTSQELRTLIAIEDAAGILDMQVDNIKRLPSWLTAAERDVKAVKAALLSALKAVETVEAKFKSFRNTEDDDGQQDRPSR